VVSKVAPRQVFCEHSGFPLSVSFHQRSLLSFIYMLLLPEGQTGEVWEPFECRGALDIRSTVPHSLKGWSVPHFFLNHFNIMLTLDLPNGAYRSGFATGFLCASRILTMYCTSLCLFILITWPRIHCFHSWVRRGPNATH